MLGRQPTGLQADLQAYRRTYSPSLLAWSEGRRPIGAAFHSSNEPSELSQWLSRWQHYKHRLGIIIIIISYDNWLFDCIIKEALMLSLHLWIYYENS